MLDKLDIGEIIEASTTEFAAESRELHSPPPFGSFVRVPLSGTENLLQATAQAVTNVTSKADEEDPFDDRFHRMAGSFSTKYRAVVQGEPETESTSGLAPAIYAVVHHATTSPVDTTKRLRAYWKDERQLQEDHPELPEWMLVTNFRAIIIGHSANGILRQLLPPQPPKLLTHVQPCKPDEIRLITSRMEFLRTLVNFRNAPTEEVVAACIREADTARGGDFDFLVAAGKELAVILGDDYDRLHAIMRRVAP